jgi:hypothetical protein
VLLEERLAHSLLVVTVATEHFRQLVQVQVYDYIMEQEVVVVPTLHMVLLPVVPLIFQVRVPAVVADIQVPLQLLELPIEVQAAAAVLLMATAEQVDLEL